MQLRGQDVSIRAVLGVGAMGLGGALLSVLQSVGMTGMSEILAGAYAATGGAVATRLAFHLYEGYPWCGMAWETAIEFVMVALWGVLAWITVEAEDPQIPLLCLCGAAGTTGFFLAATYMERARSDLVEEGIKLRRATQVLRESWLWLEVCDLFGRLDSEGATRIKIAVAGSDAEDGMLSREAFFALCAVAAIAVASGGLVIVGTVLGKPLTPEAPAIGQENGGEEGESAEGSAEEGENATVEPAVEEGAETELVVPRSDDDCAVTYDPGPRVPEPQRTALMLAWHEVDGLTPGLLEALGGDIGGCPGRAEPVPGKPDWWYAPGYCGGDLRVIAIAPAGSEHPVALLEQSADFALPLINEGEFVNATDRFPVGDGDAYVIDATGGSHVLIREHNTSGPTDKAAEEDGGCETFVDEDVPYTHVDPMLIPGWRAVAAITLGGVYPIAAAHHSGDVETFSFRSPAGIEAEGRCWPEQETCGVKIGDNWIMGDPGTETTQREVEALAEP